MLEQRLDKTFQHLLRVSPFVITAELPLHGRTGSDVLRAVAKLKPVADAVQVGDGLSQEMQMSTLAAAALVLEAGVDPVMHLTCRDRNRSALHSDLIGAAAIGVTALLLAQGHEQNQETGRAPKSVFELSATELIALAVQVGRDANLMKPPGFLAGSVSTVIDPGPGWIPNRLLQKAQLGLGFVQTQACLNVGLLRRYLSHLVATKLLHKLVVIVEVPLISSAGDIEYIKAKQPGAPLPRALIEQVLNSADPVDAGVSLCAETLLEVAKIPGVSGANIRYQGDAEAVVEAITRFRQAER